MALGCLLWTPRLAIQQLLARSAAGMALTMTLEKREGATYVCECPRPVVKLEQKRGRVIATLDDGTKMIVPTYRVYGEPAR